MNFETIKKNFDRGLFPVAQVKVAVRKKLITPEQFKEITGEDYEE
jgi:uncharacterized XkdX family phage protein